MSKIVRVECPAKTNLILTVGKPRAQWGGRHEVDTLYCALSLCDTVELRELEPDAHPTLQLEGAHLGDLSGMDIESNHAIRALRLLSAECGHTPNVAIRITKRIPVGAGLAGGSTDAAGTLLGLRTLWGLDISTADLERIGSQLGADMPFCIRGGLARGTGFGERITPIQVADMPEYCKSMLGTVLVGAYSAQLSTPVVYRTFDELQQKAAHTVLNMLQPAAIALHPRSELAITTALQAGATAAFVSGSGPTVIACIPADNNGSNHDIAERIKQLWLDCNAVDRVESCTMPVTPCITCVNIAD